MCIRDRDSASADDKKTDKEKSDTKKKSKDQVKVIQMVTNMFSTMDSVSYTHLDVYKRQVDMRVLTAITLFNRSLIKM